MSTSLLPARRFPAPRLPMTHSRARWRRATRTLAVVAAVAAFWYGVTGLLLALERSPATRVLALVVAFAAAMAGVACTRRARDADTAGGAGRAVLGGALLWTCVSTAFYSGWVVGPVTTTATMHAQPQAPSFARAADALAATAYSSVLAAVLLAVAFWAARPAGGSAGTTSRLTSRLTSEHGGAARFAPATFIALWAAHELAKLNVFAGVASPGAAYLPPYLAHLRQFFGPPHNSPLLAWSVAVLVAAAVLFGARARRATGDPARRTGLALLAGILLLAAFEHAMLGARTPLSWWEPFLSWRAAH